MLVEGEADVQRGVVDLVVCGYVSVVLRGPAHFEAGQPRGGKPDRLGATSSGSAAGGVAAVRARYVHQPGHLPVHPADAVQILVGPSDDASYSRRPDETAAWTENLAGAERQRESSLARPS